MRARRTQGDLTVNGIGGTHVVLLGFHIPKEKCSGLRGFAIHRTDHTEGEAYWLRAIKTFKETDPSLAPGSMHSTRDHPIQSFGWSDYTAKPGHRYTYTVQALKGPINDLQPAMECSVELATETPDGEQGDVHFNRGVAGTQEYARRFGNRRPEEVGDAAFRWLSRGLYEALAGFLAAGADKNHEFRVCAYEFHYPPFLKMLRELADTGATVRIIYDYRKENPGKKNAAAVRTARLGPNSKQRKTNKSAISHNKFIVRIRNGTPQSVWTGGTNFSEGGIFGHSNVAQVIDDRAIAKAFADYWDLLSEDPASPALRRDVEALTPLAPGKPPSGAMALFSPRGSLDALNWYASLAKDAASGLFMTFAFGMNDVFQDVYRNGTARMRYALLEKATRPMKEGPEREAEERKIRRLRSLPENVFAIGSHLRGNRFDAWLSERLTNLNKNVRYVHNKFMLIDPLSADPIIVGGSANFSVASIRNNDENMLILRGNTRVADIYLGEFMRLYTHHAFREWAARQRDPDPEFKHLRTDDDWWKDYFGNTSRSHRREYFAGLG